MGNKHRKPYRWDVSLAKGFLNSSEHKPAGLVPDASPTQKAQRLPKSKEIPGGLCPLALFAPPPPPSP